MTTTPLELPDVFGGVALFAVMDDNGILCEACLRDPANPVHRDRSRRDGWCVVAFDTTGNSDGEVGCDVCGKVLQDNLDDEVPAEPGEG